MGSRTQDAAGDGEALLSAVRAGDASGVEYLLVRNADTHWTDPRWNSDLHDEAFRLAVRSYEGHSAQLLLQHGADVGNWRPEELLPLREAVDSGSPALVDALLDRGFWGRYHEGEVREGCDLARHWCATGVEAELRNRTGSHDAVVTCRVQDDEYGMVEEFTLDGVSVRDGHGAILTRLEELLRIRTPFEELLDRALAHRTRTTPCGAVPPTAGAAARVGNLGIGRGAD